MHPKHQIKETDSFVARFMKAGLDTRASTLSKKAMRSTYRQLERCAKESRWGKDVTPETITKRQLQQYVQFRLSEGIKPETIHNQTSHIRRALKGVERVEFAESTCSNAALSVPAANRTGKGMVIDPEVFERARAIAPPETQSYLLAMKEMGLRVEEVVRSAPSLDVWIRQLGAGQAISVRFGTKMKRPREVDIKPDRREAVIKVVESLQDLRERNGGRVVPSVSLNAAKTFVSERLAAVGVKGDNSARSNRRDFALNKYDHYRAQGYTHKDALKLVALDLGHGEGRGRIVVNNYIGPTLAARASA